MRHALAELTALAVVPWALFFLHGTVRDPRFRFVVGLATSVALLLLTHNPAALILMPALVLYALVLAVGSGPRWRSGLVRAGSGIPAGLALSAFFWLPALWEKSFVKVGDLLHGYLHYGNHFVEPGQLVFSPWGYGLSVAGPDDGMSFFGGARAPGAPGHGRAALVLAPEAGPRARRPARSRRPDPPSAPGRAAGGRHRGDGHPALTAHSGIGCACSSTWSFRGGSCCWRPWPRPCSRPLWWRARLAVGRAHWPSWWWRGLLVFHLPLARPASFLAVNEADYGPAAIAAKNLAVTTRREYEPVWVETPPPVPAPGRPAPPGGSYAPAGAAGHAVWE